jgi:Domain of unknown function (DUF1707)
MVRAALHLRHWRYAESTYDGTRQKGGSSVSAMTGNYLPAEMRASDADRDAVVSDLSEHFQAGRLTADEFEERTGQALAARTLGELGALVADLPVTRPAGAQPTPSGRAAPPFIAALIGIGIAAVMVVDVAHGRWGFMWLLLPMLLIARRLTWSHGAPGRCGQPDQ